MLKRSQPGFTGSQLLFKLANALPKEVRIPRRAHDFTSDALHRGVNRMRLQRGEPSGHHCLEGSLHACLDGFAIAWHHATSRSAPDPVTPARTIAPLATGSTIEPGSTVSDTELPAHWPDAVRGRGGDGGEFASWNTHGYATCRYINRGRGMTPFSFHPDTEGGLMPKIAATAEVPPRRSITAETSISDFMLAILGAPNSQSQGTPNVGLVRLTYMKTLADRVRIALNDSGRSQIELAKACGIRAPSVNDWLSGKTKSLKASTAQRASAFLGVNILWLTEGRGPMRHEGRDQDTVGSSEIGLQPPSNTQNASAGAESAVMGAPEQHLAQLRSDAVIVKVFDARASMGLGLAQPEHDTVVDHIRLTKGWVRTHLPTISGPDSLAVLSAYGDSMSPTFADGDILLVDRGVHDIKVDAVYVLALNNELYIKRIQRRITDGAVIIKSDNPLYDPVVVENGERDGLRVLGRVVWAWNGRKL